METLYYLEQKRVKERIEKLKERNDYIKTVKKEWIVLLVKSFVYFLVNICFFIIYYFIFDYFSFLLSIIFIFIWLFCFLYYFLFFIIILAERNWVKDKLSEYLKLENKHVSDRSPSLPLIVNLSLLLNVINIILFFAGAFGLTMISLIK